MSDIRGAWTETGDKLTELGRKLKVRYEAQHGTEGQQTREELTDAARRLGAAVQDAFETLGTAARDKAVQDDVKQVGQSLLDALGATVGQAAEELRRALSERKGPDAPGATRPEPGPAEPGPAEPGPAEPGEKDGGEQPPRVEPWGTP